jgi:hypothetical protein
MNMANSNGFTFKDYTESDTVKAAKAALDQHSASKPGEYKSAWQTQLNDVINKIMNREDFSYDLNGDALYQQYKDKFVQQGKMAMMDTMGQAQAMTGGYGNSYAQSVGQQAYQAELQNLNDVVPELYQMALDKYNMEGQDMYNQASLLGAQDDRDYGRYRDQMSDWNAETDRLQNQYNAEREFDYGKYTGDRKFSYDQHIDDRNYQYQIGRDFVTDHQWQTTFDEGVRQFDAQHKLNQDQFDWQKSQAGDSGGGGGNNSSGGNSGNTGDTGNQGSVSDNIRDRAAGYKDNNDLANYLDGLTASGTITEGQADSLYAEYKQPEQAALSKRSWKLDSDGGINWLWGIDNNATVKDQYGNTYRLDKLVDALVAEGMSKKAAKEYVKNLQKRLGA